MLQTEEQELLSAYLDNALTDKDQAMVKNRLAESAEWQQELNRLRETKNMLGALPAIQVPAEFLDSIEAAVLPRQPEPKPGFSWSALQDMIFRPWVMGGSLATAGALIAVLFVGRAADPQPIPVGMLLAAHTSGQTTPFVHQRVIAASRQSSELKQHAQS